MTPESSTLLQNADTPAPAPADQRRAGPGEIIRHARERARMTPDELAAQLKLPRSTLEALETDDFETLVEPVYVRGYYRKCAKLLGLTESELLDAYAGEVTPRAPSLPSKLHLASGAELGSGSRLPVALAIVAAIAAVVICAVLWFARSEQTVPAAVAAKAAAIAGSEAPSAGTASVTTAAPAVAAAAAPASPAPATPAAATEVSAPSAQSAQSVPTPVAAQSQGAPVPEATAPAADSQIALDVKADTWARIEDASGKRIVDGMLHAGDHPVLSGQAPYKVFLGNAAGVKVEIGGKPVDITRYTADNKTARFTLPPDGAQ